MVITRELSLNTRGHTDIEDITGLVKAVLADSGLAAGIVTIFCPGSTGGLTTIEYEDGVVRDLQQVLDEIERMRATFSVAIETYDERLTTVTADRSLAEQRMGAKARRKVVDKVAAAVMLQAWLDAQTPNLPGDR